MAQSVGFELTLPGSMDQRPPIFSVKEGVNIYFRKIANKKNDESKSRNNVQHITSSPTFVKSNGMVEKVI